jgi:mRNA-degrading endonuclease toxin of MazEF toxin-antitoxin module
MKRGDILIVDFSVYNPREKVRPALAVQNDLPGTSAAPVSRRSS